MCVQILAHNLGAPEADAESWIEDAILSGALRVRETPDVCRVITAPELTNDEYTEIHVPADSEEIDGHDFRRWLRAVASAANGGAALSTAMIKSAAPKDSVGQPRKAKRFQAADAQHSQHGAARRTALDDIGREIEEIIAKIGEPATPLQIMTALKARAGQDGSCIMKQPRQDGVFWRRTGAVDSEVLTIRNLRDRLSRRRQRAKTPR
jgi:hypothetical protein